MKKYNSLQEIQRDIKDGKVSCKTLVNHYLTAIEEKKHLNAFLEVYSTSAIQAAETIDKKIANGSAGKLAGMVIGIKDVLCYKDHGLTSSSKILKGFKSQFTATAIQKLLDEDVIIIGRQNCDEFAMGSSNESSAFGPALNAANNNHVPGGSSGGSAVAVQADLCLASLGTDTGGSVRQPASFCGIIGLKPTYSRISRYGLAAYASSFDTIGTLTRSIEDAALLLETMAGKDDFDSTVSQKEVPKYAKKTAFNKKLKIGYFEAGIAEGLQPEVKENTLKAIEKLKQDGHELQAFKFNLIDHILPTYYILTTAEASSNLSRYDGVRYGFRSENNTDLESLYKKSRSEGFGKEVKKRIMLGTFVLSAGYYDAYYTKAQKMRRLIQEETDRLLSEFDVLLLPTSPTTAFELGANNEDSLAMYLADIFTVQASLCGIPGISVPNGVDSKGLPIGIQFLGQHFSEDNLLAFSKHFLSLN